MHAHPHRRRIRPAISVLCVAALVVVCGSGTAAAAAATTKVKPKPKKPTVHKVIFWSGQYTGALTGTFTLHWTQSGSTLTGKITLSTPNGTYNIGGSVNGSTISFGAVGAGATYKGSVSKDGKSMSGTWNSPIGSGSWSAQKSS